MFSNQSVSRFRCKHQANHWCHGLYLPYQVLVLVFLFLLSPSVLAEKEYYTWVDEFGRVHNTLINPSAQDEQQDDSSNSSLVNPDEYLTEEEFEQQSKQDRSENPEFYTWVDEHGRVRNQAVPQVNVTVEEDDDFSPLVTDHTLVQPL